MMSVPEKTEHYPLMRIMLRVLNYSSFKRTDVRDAEHDCSAHRLIAVGGAEFAVDVFVVEFDAGIADIHHLADFIGVESFA